MTATQNKCLEGAECKGTCEEWEEEIDKLMMYEDTFGEVTCNKYKIKDFIRTLIVAERFDAFTKGRAAEAKVCEGCANGGLTRSQWVRMKVSFDDKLAAERTKAKEEGRQEERERINEYFGTKADCNTDTDEVIISDKVYHDAFNPNGCTKIYCEYCKHY